MFTIGELTTAYTSDQVFEYLLTLLEAIQVPARSWRTGGVARSILGVVSQVGAQATSVVSSLVAGGFLLLGTNDYLTVHAKDVYNVDRIAATFATGSVTLFNGGGAVYTVGANQLIVSASTSGARFRVTDSFVLPSNGQVTVAVMAIESGSDSTVSAGDIDTLETVLARVTVSNVASIVGADAESDAALVARCLASKATWSPLGPRDAYAFAVLSSKLLDGSPTSISRVSVSPSSSTGQVAVVCATPSGPPSSDELTAAIAAIEAQARPDTVTVTVTGAIVVATSQSIIVWCKGGTQSVILANAGAALNKLISNYPIGGVAKTDGGQGYLYLDAIAAAVIGANPTCFDIDFADTAVDFPLAANEVAVNTATFDVRIR